MVSSMCNKATVRICVGVGNLGMCLCDGEHVKVVVMFKGCDGCGVVQNVYGGMWDDSEHVGRGGFKCINVGVWGYCTGFILVMLLFLYSASLGQRASLLPLFNIPFKL